MKLLFFLCAVFAFCACQAQNTGQNLQNQVAILDSSPEQDSLIISKIYQETLLRGKSYQNLQYLCTKIGARFTATTQAAKAVEWTKALMDSLQLDSVWLQPVKVPQWIRGKKEKGQIVGKKGKVEVPICALGGSVGTGSAGLQAALIEVKRIEDLQGLGEEKIKGKIVFFNQVMNPAVFDTFEAYGDAGKPRRNGASEAAKFGAIAVIVRSLTPNFDDFPHTGSMTYQFNVRQIPAVAISTNGADLLSKNIAAEPNLQFYLETHCKSLEETISYNVIGELRGSEKPKEIIVVGGHLDSWDLAQGAHDDGAGCMQTIEVLRVMKKLELKPRRTIRIIMYMNEEFGNRGGIKYAQYAEEVQQNLKHIAALESDRGGFTPRGFYIDASPEKIKIVESWLPLLQPYGIYFAKKGGAGVDITPLKVVGTTLIGYVPDSQRYFDLHHTAQDTFDKVNKRELELGAAAMTALVYLLAEYGI
jgi:carboxypeptidase Q